MKKLQGRTMIGVLLSKYMLTLLYIDSIFITCTNVILRLLHKFNTKGLRLWKLI